MTKNESLTFDITLSGTYWNKKPEYSVWLDDTQIERKIITTASDELFTVKFDPTLSEGPHIFKVRLENKEPTDTKLLDDDTIEKDMLLNIESIVIDDIDLGNLKWTKSYFLMDEMTYIDNEYTNKMDSCVNLGLNGSYIIEFSSPYYLWLLENL